jgi:hypothetical protein
MTLVRRVRRQRLGMAQQQAAVGAILDARVRR